MDRQMEMMEPGVVSSGFLEKSKASDFKAVEAAGRLPAEVDAQALIQWLWSVRVRMAKESTAT